MSQSHPHPTLQLLYKMTETLEQSMSGPCPCPVCRNRYDMKPVGSQMSRKLSWVEVRTINVLLQSRGSSYNIPNPPEVEYIANNIMLGTILHKMMIISENSGSVDS